MILLKNIFLIVLGLNKHESENPQNQTDELPSVRMLRRIAYGSIKVTLLCMILGMILQYLIPGCHCNEAVGCIGCGINQFLNSFSFLDLFGLESIHIHATNTNDYRNVYSNCKQMKYIVTCFR